MHCLTRVERLLQTIPGDYFKVCSDRQYWAAKYIPRGLIDGYDSIMLNRDNHLHVLAVDVDDPERTAAVIDLPDDRIPNVLVVDPQTCRSHGLYVLGEPVHVTSHPSSHRMQKFAQDVRKRLTMLVGGDQAFSNGFVKNPLCARYDVYVLRDQLHRLADLGRVLPSLPRNNREEHRDYDQAVRWIDQNKGPATFEVGRRNHDMFWQAVRRCWIARYADPEVAYETVVDEMLAINSSLSDPLDDEEVEQTVRSAVNNYTSFRRTLRSNPDWNIGVMELAGRGRFAGLTPEQALHEAQSLGASYCHKTRKANTFDHLRRIAGQLGRATKKGLARAAGVSVQTVKRYWSRLFPSLAVRHQRQLRSGSQVRPPVVPTCKDFSVPIAVSPVQHFTPSGVKAGKMVDLHPTSDDLINQQIAEKRSEPPTGPPEDGLDRALRQYMRDTKAEGRPWTRPYGSHIGHEISRTIIVFTDLDDRVLARYEWHRTKRCWRRLDQSGRPITKKPSFAQRAAYLRLKGRPELIDDLI